MEIFIKVFHILVSVVLIFVVLLQSGKGASMGAAFGGSSNALFGATGSNTFMTKLTTFIAVLFIITCFSLAYMSRHMATSSLMSDVSSEMPPIPAQSAPMGAPGDSVIPPTPEGAAVPGERPPLQGSADNHEGHNHPPGEGH